MEFIETEISDVKILVPQVFGDERGFFMETYRQSDFAKHCSEKVFVQDNHSRSNFGILRGLHYQTENTQGKLVRVTQGEVFDVAVDLRESSKTFGRYVGVVLSAENKKQMWVPAGFAHGFYVMSETAEFVYKCNDYYAPDYEVSIRWDDPEIGIDWPIRAGTNPQLSAKDEQGLSFKDAPKFA
ncbi:dTDP-4-dehydrorhamnose 3,5-epimerase [Aliikangiella marina]|uniref:dTDP-4-dehydrorhamnose 3,5-epimerase n=1 Tax=Aliikangiella marina TaxID=1712262 RepID=A0A545TBK5_9GAMM|nr:dTDP-4-dehydrorhamnose 3,5-epimerase [Aliikangiella marina]TQV74581.1 dTDP-4-dehydrorhamnose 3,5-epimerase [Aliikangiella marina]